MFIRIIVIVFLEDVILSQFTPKVVLFQPVDPSAKFGKGFALELPRIAVLLLVEPNILLLTIFAIMHNSKVAAVDDAGGGVVHFFDGQHAGGVFAALIPISRRYAVDRVAQPRPYFFWRKLLFIVVDLNIDIEIKAYVGLGIARNHITR